MWCILVECRLYSSFSLQVKTSPSYHDIDLRSVYHMAVCQPYAAIRVMCMIWPYVRRMLAVCWPYVAGGVEYIMARMGEKRFFHGKN